MKFKNSWVSLVAIVLASLSLLICMAPEIYYAVTPQPQYTQDQQITNLLLTVKKVKQNLKEQSQGQGTASQKVPKVYDFNTVSMYASLCIAILAIFFSVIAYIKKENRRIYIGPIALSAVTILINFIWIALGIVALMLLLKALESFDIF